MYDRFENIRQWLQCWKKCNTLGAELIIIQNYYGDNTLRAKFKSYCDDNNIKYIPRNGQGFDIGCLQDVFKERLTGFPNDWDYILWVCDDTLPMSKDFIEPFLLIGIQTTWVGISCMQISSSVSPHVRTSGFCISKEVASKIQFPVDPVTTKTHCYFFEHRGGQKTFTNQIRAMGLDCVQVAPINISPLWDSMHPNINKRLDRQQEFNKVWDLEHLEHTNSLIKKISDNLHDKLFKLVEKQIPTDKVVFICPVYDMYPQIISSLICQTHANWELLLIHNGPLNGFKYDIPDDERVKFIIYPEATGKWGHLLRQWALKEKDLGNYTVITNADNYYVPTFIEYMLKGFKNGTVATYCRQMTHSYKAWQVIDCKLELGYLDSGGVMVKSEVAKEIGWNDVVSHSSDFTYFSDIAKKYNWSNFMPVRGNLFVHN